MSDIFSGFSEKLSAEVSKLILICKEEYSAEKNTCIVLLQFERKYFGV